MDSRIEARGRVIHAALGFAGQVWAEWADDEVDGLAPDPMETHDAHLDIAVRSYARHLGMVEASVAWPHLDDEVPAEVVKAAKSLYAVERLRSEPGLREQLTSIIARPWEISTSMDERRRGAMRVLSAIDGIHDEELMVLPDYEEFVDLSGAVAEEQAEEDRRMRTLALALVFMTIVALALFVKPSAHWPVFVL